MMLPFGNGAERMLSNQDIGASIHHIDFNLHSEAHLARAAQEGIVYAFHYGMMIMKQIGIEPSVIRAGNSNMFLSPVFRDTLASISGATIELYDTDGSMGAAKGAGIGAGIYNAFEDAFENLRKLMVIEPDMKLQSEVRIAYDKWKHILTTCMQIH